MKYRYKDTEGTFNPKHVVQAYFELSGSGPLLTLHISLVNDQCIEIPDDSDGEARRIYAELAHIFHSEQRHFVVGYGEPT